MNRPSSLARTWAAVLATAVALGCADRTTGPGTRPSVLRVVPTFAQSAGTPILAVDELRIRVFDESGEVLLVQRSVAVSPSDREVEVELEVDAAPGDPLVVEVSLLQGGTDVYVGGPVAVLPADVPVEVPVVYVGEGACQETVGSAVVGSLGGAPGVVQGALAVGDCYLSETETFADRWRLDLPADAGIDVGVVSGGAGELRLRLERDDGSLLADGDTDAFSLAVAAGSYVVVVTSAQPLAAASYDLTVGEFDRCDAEVGLLTPGTGVAAELTAVACPLPGGWVADPWGVEVTTDTPYRLDLESESFDARLFLTDAGTTDPFAGEPLDQDDDRGLGTDALLAGVLPAGRYRAWATTFSPGESGAYAISFQPLARGAPNLVVREVSALGVGALNGVCQSAQTFLFDFGFEDGDGDLVSPGGISIRVTGIPSGAQVTKGQEWDGFSDLNPFAGYAQFVLCETFGPSETAKDAEVFLTDAAGRVSAIFSTRLTPGVTGSASSGSVAGSIPVARAPAVAVIRR